MTDVTARAPGGETGPLTSGGSPGGGSTGHPRVIVVGGGLAGLSAAVACADSGAAVTLLESRPRLGGATWSFERRGLHYDNGQHVHLRCCTAYRAWLDRLGTAEQAPFAGPLSIPVVRPATPRPTVAWIRRDRHIPAPGHLGRSLLSYAHLSLVDRLRLLPAALLMRSIDLDDCRLDSQTFADWLRRHGQSDLAISRLWDLITIPTTNLPASEVSFALAAKVFQTGLLTDAGGADIAWSAVPLAELHVEPARRLLEAKGADIRTRAKVTEVVLGGAGTSAPSSARGVAVDGEILEAEAVILAVPHEVAAELVPAAADADAARYAHLGSVPIVNVHLVFDRKVMPYRLAVGVDSPVQFVFDRTAAAGLDSLSGGQVLAVSLSAADHLIGERPETLVEEQVRGLRAVFPAARGAEVVDALVSREHHATFRGVPGTLPLRPPATTGIANLALAGAWTDTGWPATMEGAVRSGNAAAERALAAVGYRSAASPRREEVVA